MCIRISGCLTYIRNCTHEQVLCSYDEYPSPHGYTCASLCYPHGTPFLPRSWRDHAPGYIIGYLGRGSFQQYFLLQLSLSFRNLPQHQIRLLEPGWRWVMLDNVHTSYERTEVNRPPLKAGGILTIISMIPRSSDYLQCHPVFQCLFF